MTVHGHMTVELVTGRAVHNGSGAIAASRKPISTPQILHWRQLAEPATTRNRGYAVEQQSTHCKRYQLSHQVPLLPCRDKKHGTHGEAKIETSIDRMPSPFTNWPSTSKRWSAKSSHPMALAFGKRESRSLRGREDYKYQLSGAPSLDLSAPRFSHPSLTIDTHPPRAAVNHPECTCHICGLQRSLLQV
jgi:hypothetical protein